MKAHESSDGRANEENEACLAPFGMLRVAALAYCYLSEMAPLRTATHISRALTAQVAMTRVQGRVETLLRAVTPTVTEPALRRATLALKRDVHNARSPDVRVLEHVRLLLPPLERTFLDVWRIAQARVSAELLAAESALHEETVLRVRGGVRNVLNSEPFLRALALASPDLCREVDRERLSPPTGNRPASTDRSLLRYAMRAAAKTSPFSSFMHQGPVAMQPGSEAAAWDTKRAIRVSRTVIRRDLLTRIYRATLIHYADWSVPLFRVNSTLRATDARRIEGLLGEYVVFEGRAWRTDGVGSVDCHPALITSLLKRTDSPISRAELIDLITAAGIESARAKPLLVELVERGIIWEDPWTDGFDQEPEARVIANLSTSKGYEVETTRQSVATMASIGTSVAGVGGWARLSLLTELEGLVERAGRTAGARGSTGRNNNVFEDGFLQGLDGSVGGPMCRQLMDIGGLLRSRLVVAPAYLALCRMFVRTYGPNGRCTDVVRFLMDYTRQPPAADLAPATGGSVCIEGKSAPRAGVTVFLQISSPDSTTAAAGRGTIVINQVLNGIGWISARHAVGESDDHARLREWLASWLVQAVHPREPVDLLGRGECSNLQVHPRLTRRVLRWPSEPIRSGTQGVVPLERCVLTHDGTTGLLELRDDRDVPLAPVYLGSTVAVGLGLMSLLLLLSQPLQVRWPMMMPPPPSCRTSVVFRPRVGSGRIVSRRATWWVRSRHLRTAWFAHSGVRRLLDVASDLRANGIPHVFFAQISLPREPDRLAALREIDRKPVWVDTRNPLCLEMLERLATRARWIKLSEMLPDPTGLWTEMDGERFVSELHCEMCLGPTRVRLS